MTVLPPCDREPFSSLLLYQISKWSLLKPMFHSLFQGKVYGRENVPLKGPLVVVSNHASYIDPPFLSIGLGRPLAYMAKEELFVNPILKNIIELYGAYPVKKGTGDRSAIRAALDATAQGWAVGIFIEGTRTVDSRIHEPKLGASLIAAKAQAPLLPVSLWGTQSAFRSKFPYLHSTPVAIRIGKIISPPRLGKREELLTVTRKCADEINHLHDQGY